jgi:hypothetical protein
VDAEPTPTTATRADDDDTEWSAHFVAALGIELWPEDGITHGRAELRPEMWADGAGQIPEEGRAHRAVRIQGQARLRRQPQPQPEPGRSGDDMQDEQDVLDQEHGRRRDAWTFV